MDKETLEKSAKLIQTLRKELGSVESIDGPQLTDGEFKSMASDAEIFFAKHMEKVLRLFVKKQKDWISEQALNDGQLVFGRGTINGLYLIEQWFRDKIAISQSRFEKEEKPEPGEAP